MLFYNNMSSLTFSSGFRANCLSPSGTHRFSPECRFVLYDGVGAKLCRKPAFYWNEKAQMLPCCTQHLGDYIDVAKVWDPKLFRRPRLEEIPEETGGNE
jgi:hypothetical protein